MALRVSLADPIFVKARTRLPLSSASEPEKTPSVVWLTLSVRVPGVETLKAVSTVPAPVRLPTVAVPFRKLPPMLNSPPEATLTLGAPFSLSTPLKINWLL